MSLHMDKRVVDEYLSRKYYECNILIGLPHLKNFIIENHCVFLRVCVYVCVCSVRARARVSACTTKVREKIPTSIIFIRRNLIFTSFRISMSIMWQI